MKGAATWISFTLAAASAVWGGEVPASPGKGPLNVGGEVEIANVPFDINEVIRTVRKNRGLPEEPPKRGFHAEARGERPFVSKGNAFSHETPRFQAEVGEDGLRYFAQGSRGKPDFEILSVSFEQGGNTQTVFGRNHLEEHAPGLLQGEARDGITSYVRNRGEEGMEIYWTIGEPLGPEASALRVRLAIRAAGEPREHPEGLIFPTWDGSGQVAFSNVTVVDSAGRLERIRPSLATSQEILFEVSREFLENSRYPILIDPTVGPEFPVEPNPVIGPMAEYQRSPSVASNGTDYFVAWEDNRSGGADYGIYGARVASDGTVLDPTGIAVSTAADNLWSPSVASNGTDYFVAWQDHRGASYDIYGARVTSAGAVLDSAGIAVSTAANDQVASSVASNGTDYFVAWHDFRSGNYDIYGARVASDGTVLDPGGIAVSTAASAQYRPAAASNGTDYFVAWEDDRSGTDYDIYGARVTSAGTVLDPAGIAVSTAADNQLYPSVASNGTDYFVAWEDRRSGRDIYGARVTSAGVVLDPTPTDIAVSTAANNQYIPSVASNGTDYFVAWKDSRNGTDYDIYGARVTSAGTVLDPAGIAVSTAAGLQQFPSVASNGTDYFVAWHDNRNGGFDNIYGTRVASLDGTVLDPIGIAVSTAASFQYSSSATSNGTDYFVVWEDYRDGLADIYGTRVTAAGVVLDLSGIAVSTAADNQYSPSVASNGTDYFVAWEDRRSGRDIYGARVRASDGLLLDGPPDTGGIVVSTAVDNQWIPSVASNGTDYFVAWGDYRNSGTTGWDIYGARVRASDGLLLDGPPGTGGIAVSTAANEQWYPSMASNGADYFVAWEDYRSGPAPDIYGTRVASDGTVLDPAGIAVSTAANGQGYPSAASNGTDYFVAWMDARSGVDYDIYGARVAWDGTVLDPAGIAVSTAANGQGNLSAASNGTDYFVAWEDHRSGTGFSDIYGARVASDGTVLDAAGILIQQSPYNNDYPAVAYSSCGKYLVAYERFHDDPNFQSQRVMARMFYDEISVAYDSSTFTDCGNADGAVDPGETIDLNVTVQNTGGADAFNVSGVLSTTTPGITIPINSASFPDIPTGLTGVSLTPLQFVVGAGVPCGTLIDFTLDLSYEDSFGGCFFGSTSSFQVLVSGMGTPSTLLSENFNLGLPGTWTVVDGPVPPDGNTWNDADPCARGLFPDTYMIVDSDCAGSVAMDEELITPLIDASAEATVTLTFEHDFLGYDFDGANDDFATVWAKSVKTSGAWTSLIQWNETQSNAGMIVLDATAKCAGAADCQFKWRYEGFYDWYWGVDNVVVEAISLVCNPAVCIGAPSEPSSPSALDPLIIPTTAADQIIVEDVENETGYVVYENAIGTWYGTPSQGCLWGADVVDLGATVQLNYLLGAGDRWVVVSAANAAGESSCGMDSAGAERNAQPGWPPSVTCP